MNRPEHQCGLIQREALTLIQSPVNQSKSKSVCQQIKQTDIEVCKVQVVRVSGA